MHGGRQLAARRIAPYRREVNAANVWHLLVHRLHEPVLHLGVSHLQRRQCRALVDTRVASGALPVAQP